MAAYVVPTAEHRPGVMEAVLHMAAGLSVTVAGIHLWAAPQHFVEWWGYGAFFLVVALAQGLGGVALLRWPSGSLFVSGIAGNLALVSLYVVTRTSGLPFGPHAGMAEAAGALDLVCVALELCLIATLVARGGLLPVAARLLAPAIVQAASVGLALHFSYIGAHGSGMDPVLHYLQTSALALPLSLLALMPACLLLKRAGAMLRGDRPGETDLRLVWSLTAASVSAPVVWLSGGFASAPHAAAALGVSFVALFAFASLRGLPWEEPKQVDLRRPRLISAAAGTALALAVLAGPTVLSGISAPSAEAQPAPASSCNASSYDRSYDVAAVNVRVPYNRWGGMDPHGQAYVLQGDKNAVKGWSQRLGATPAEDPADAQNRRLRPRPLVIRANVGECVKVDFTNELNAQGEDGLPNSPRASMKVFGPLYDAQTSDGSAVGFNEDTTVAIGQSISYFWRVPDQEGIYLFRDQGATMGSEANGGSLGHGLYGALAVEPAGSTWTDPTTGEPLYVGETNHSRITKQSGDPYIDADIHPRGAPSFRETVQISQDELPGGQGFGFNYGAEPGFNRVAVNPAGDGGAEQLAPDSIGEETSLSSWTYGDPALVKLASGEGPWLPKPDPDNPGSRISPEDCGLENRPGGSCYVSNVVHSYPGDPTKIRFAHAGVKETHVFHMHAHQWLAEPEDVGDSGAPSGEITDANRPDSSTIDSQTYGPGETFTADLLYGAGSKPGTFGDSIFHCHLYPHFADGFWSLFRVHDVKEAASNTPEFRKTPDGINVRPLVTLPDRSSAALSPPTPTADNPGYPRFMPGKFGWRAPQPPGGISESNGNDDLPNTLEREDLDPAERVVAGRPLDDTLDPGSALEAELAAKLETEKQVQQRNYGAGNDPVPGAPFTDPCPANSRKVTYNVSVIQTDITYNEAGWHDKQGRMLVLNKDVEDVLAGRKEPEPLFIRVNAGDCVDFNLTNRLPNWFGGDEFVQLAQTNMIGEHIHLVKFDVLGSDGSSNGWNYQQAAFTDEQADFNKDLDADGNVRNCSWSECRVQTPASWDPAQAGAPPGQTIHERWYADYELRTVFTHDHHFPALDQNRGLFGAMIVEPGGTDFRNPKTGEFYQPVNDPANGEVCAGADNACNGGAAGTAMDVIGPGDGDDFREFGLAVQDFVSLHRSDAEGGAPIQAPASPEEFPDEDPGVMGINYRNAPFVLRNSRNGQPTDPAHVFSSTVHGDPETPVFEAYSEDPVRMRVLQGSQEEQHVVSVHGMRWRQEPDDPESPLVNSQAVGISEAFNFQVPRITCGANDPSCAGDYLYGGTATDDMYLGVWGLLRARGREVPSLLPLPDNVPRTEGQSLTPRSVAAPPEASTPGTPCPAGAPVKSYNVVAMQADLRYNKDDDHDPNGLIYALASDEAAIRAGDKKPEPLVLRANEGDCIEVRLTNRISASWLQNHPNAGAQGDPTLPLEPPEGTPAGLRASLHPQLVEYDVRGSDGTAVGFNRDQTVAPGESRLYRWYADDPTPAVAGDELGATNLTDFGDVRGHRHHGLFAGLIVEPKNATYHDPQTGQRIQSGASADIRVPGGGGDFREFVPFFQDGLNLHDANGPIEDEPDHPPTPDEPVPGALDAEDQGEKGFNYTNAPFVHRIGENPEGGMVGQAMSDVFSSRAISPVTGQPQGDPDTPIFRAFAGDDVRMRVLQGSDKPRQHTFQVSGHSWIAQPDDPGSTRIGTQGGISVGRAFNLELSGADYPGDYRYGSGVGFHHLPGGLWGIMRVYPRPAANAALNPTPIPEVDDPRAGGHPILPLEVSASETSISLRASGAAIDFGGTTTLSGKLSAPAGVQVSERRVVIEQKPFGASGFTRAPGQPATGVLTRTDGSFRLANVAPTKNTEYRATFAGRPDVLSSGSATVRVDVRAVVTTVLSATSIKNGRSVTVSGEVRPVHRGSVDLVVKRGTKTIVTRRVSLANGRYDFRYKPPGTGSYTVSVAFRPDDDHAGGSGPEKGFKVTR